VAAGFPGSPLFFMKRILFLFVTLHASLLAFLLPLSGKLEVATSICAQQVEYTPADSARIVSILKTAETERGNEPRMYYFGRQLENVPYVAHTLEVGEKEHLVVNIHELDCSTFMETVTALTLCDVNGKRTFKDFCHYLQQIRYRQGKLTDYTSRLHYFTWWSEDNVKKGFVKAMDDDTFTATQTLRLNFMSQHPNSYKHLKAHPEFVKTIRRYEQQYDGTRWPYIPKSKLGGSPRELPAIHTGDIISIITKKEGLDNSHVGIAFWRKGKLHLMHASSIKKRVILDLQTFYDYCQAQQSVLGIRVYRVIE